MLYGRKMCSYQPKIKLKPKKSGICHQIFNKKLYNLGLGVLCHGDGLGLSKSIGVGGGGGGAALSWIKIQFREGPIEWNLRMGGRDDFT